jgi:hypothetical protein
VRFPSAGTRLGVGCSFDIRSPALSGEDLEAPPSSSQRAIAAACWLTSTWSVSVGGMLSQVGFTVTTYKQFGKRAAFSLEKARFGIDGRC